MHDIWDKMQEHLRYCNEHYNEMDDEAKKTVDRVFESLNQTIGQIIPTLDESVAKRKLVRQHAIAAGKHHRISDLLTCLERPPQTHLQVGFTKEARELFDYGTQQVSDLLYDISQDSLGYPQNVCFGLFFHCLDELMAGMHLAQHAYCMQAYSHARSTIECLEKIELFHQQPQWCDLWTSNDEKTIRRELSPGGVRKKLGNPRYDPLYGFLSKLGSHSSFKSLQGRIAWEPKTPEEGRDAAHVWYGGSPQEHHMLWAHYHVLFGVSLLRQKVMTIFLDRLNQDELMELSSEFTLRYVNWLLKHYIPWAKRQGLPVEEIEQEMKDGLVRFGLVKQHKIT